VTTITFTNIAPEGVLIHPEAFRKNIGRDMPLTRDGHRIGTARIMDALVATDQRSVTFVIDTVDNLGLQVEGLTLS
jgi:hypothetical protein